MAFAVTLPAATPRVGAVVGRSERSCAQRPPATQVAQLCRPDSSDAAFLPRRGFRAASRPAAAARPLAVRRPDVEAQAPAASAGPVPMPRIGHGFDLHRLEPDNKLIVGGVKLEHDRGCVGHSDGDVVLHCVTDAILGALSLPDIGQLFPDNDPRFKGADSRMFLEEAARRMRAAGYEVGNLDVTIILERPKLSPHKAAIRQNIAEMLGADVERVNVKAKTHEKVDSLGENRSIGCHSVVMLLPAVPRPAPPAAAPAAASVPSAQWDTVLDRLSETIQQRKGEDPTTSYTAKLLSKGVEKIAQKVGEEAVELAIEAAAVGAPGADQAAAARAVVSESADLLYHLLVLWAASGVSPGNVWAELQQREGISGVAEKASRGSSSELRTHVDGATASARSASAVALAALYEIVAARRGADPASSYTARLLSKGAKRIAQKVGEEAVETVVAATLRITQDLVSESADLMYHLIVLWVCSGVEPSAVFGELERREGTSGLAEKAARSAAPAS